MILIGQDVLVKAGRKNPTLRRWLASWSATVEAVTWNSIEDVRRAYPSADGVKLRSMVVVTAFNVKGNEYRLLSTIDYDVATVEALEVITHAEYDKDFWKDRY
jgi:mRNA interferase HigB